MVPGRARSDPDSPYRDFYVWSDEQPKEKPGDLVFPDQESSNWAYDRKAQQYYLHKFYSHQPDLNLANPEVRDELAQVMGFWLEQGLSGFRVDAVPFLIEGAMDDPHQVLRDLRAYLSRRNGEAVLLGEVNLAAQGRARVPRRRGRRRAAHGARLHRQPGAVPGARARRGGAAGAGTARLPGRSRRARRSGRFVRNHDELTLDKLSEEERAEVFARFGPDPDMQLYGRGLRRRLPTMLDGDARAIRMVYSLAFSLPGTPVLFYGEEIGMAENPAIEGRYAVRPPMQWSPDGGFSTHDRAAPPDGRGRVRAGARQRRRRSGATRTRC